LEELAPRAELRAKSHSKHLKRQPITSALNDAKCVSGAMANRPLDTERPSTKRAKNLSQRAKEEMVLWRKRLSRKDRPKLCIRASPWGRQGGSVITRGLRHGKTARKREKLKRQREARFKAEQAAYEALRALPSPIKDTRST